MRGKKQPEQTSLWLMQGSTHSEEPETEWLWEGILPAGGLSLLVAKPKVGKTTLAFRLGFAVTSGKDFLGRKY